jgi:hypothetical protein
MVEAKGLRAVNKPDSSLLSDARLVWAMACDCDCRACQALDVVIQSTLVGYTKRSEVMNVIIKDESDV